LDAHHRLVWYFTWVFDTQERKKEKQLVPTPQKMAMIIAQRQRET